LQLQLLANFHFLFAAAFLQPADALLAAVVLQPDVGIPLLQLTNLAPLEERNANIRLENDRRMLAFRSSS
jgi:hypothetical protein